MIIFLGEVLSVHDEIKKVIENFESENGIKINKISTNKLILWLREDFKEIKQKMDGDTKSIYKQLSDHDKLFQEVMDKLPEKGFCQRVTNMLELNKKTTLADKVETMWHDRRWIKKLLGLILTAILLLGGGNIIIQIL